MYMWFIPPYHPQMTIQPAQQTMTQPATQPTQPALEQQIQQEQDG